MPVIAAVGVIGGAVALTTTTTVLGTIAALGSIVGGIGALTGNKTLMKIGAVAGLAGGIGAFAQSQGWLATSGAVAAEQGVSNTAAMASQSSSLVENVAPVVESGAGAAGATGEMVTQGIGDAAAAAGTTGGLDAAASGVDAAGGLSQSITQANPMLEQGGGLMNAGAQEPVSSLAGAQGSAALGGAGDATAMLGKAQLDGTNVFGANSAPGALSLAGGGNKVFDVIGKFGDLFKNKDGSLNKDLMKIGADFIGGAFDDRKKAETDFRNAQADEIRQQMENANAVPNGKFRNKSRGPLFKPGQPTYRAPRIGGLMNAR